MVVVASARCIASLTAVAINSAYFYTRHTWRFYGLKSHRTENFLVPNLISKPVRSTPEDDLAMTRVSRTID